MRYLALKRIELQCPVCKEKQFNVNGPVAYTGADAQGKSILGISSPMMLAICGSCFHTLQFAWLPLRNAAHALDLQYAKEKVDLHRQALILFGESPADKTPIQLFDRIRDIIDGPANEKDRMLKALAQALGVEQ